MTLITAIYCWRDRATSTSQRRCTQAECRASMFDVCSRVTNQYQKKILGATAANNLGAPIDIWTCHHCRLCTESTFIPSRLCESLVQGFVALLVKGSSSTQAVAAVISLWSLVINAPTSSCKYQLQSTFYVVQDTGSLSQLMQTSSKMPIIEGVLVSDLLHMGAEELRARGILTGAASTSSRASSLSSTTPDAEDPVVTEIIRLDSLFSEHEFYHQLIQDGGRPSHRPNDAGFDYLYKPQTGIIWYWISVCVFRECLFQEQHRYWQKFREYQDWRRRRYCEPERFELFVQEVMGYRQKKGLEGDVYLLQDRQKQTRLQDWVEFQYWEYCHADRLLRSCYAGESSKQKRMLQAVTDTDQPAKKADWTRDHTIAIMERRQGGAGLVFERQAALLEWIDEQFRIIASECQVSAFDLHATDDCRSPLFDRGPGMRKRPAHEIEYPEKSRRRVRFVESCVAEPSLAENTDARDLALVGIFNRKPSGILPAKSRQNSHTSPEPCTDNDTIPTLEESSPVTGKLFPELTNTLAPDDTRALPGHLARVKAELKPSASFRKRSRSAPPGPQRTTPEHDCTARFSEPHT
nr:hypothetical protein CFP56_22426 [Quercus suber]